MDCTRHLCSLKTFKWSESEVTLEELVTCYRHLLPFPVLVTTDYGGGVECQCMPSKGDVFWVHAALDNPWIVVKDKEGRRYKISQCFDAMVLPIKPDGTEGIAFPFRGVREHGGYKYIRFVQPSKIVASDVKHNRRQVVVGDLEVVDVYDVTVIAVHELHMEYLMDDLHPQQCKQKSQGSVVPPAFHFLPSSAPLGVSLALTLAKAPDVIFFHTMAEIKALVDNYRHNYLHHLQQSAVILVENVAESDDSYEYITMSKKQGRDKAHLRQVSKPHQAPVASDIDPTERLRDLRRFYDTGEMALPGESDYVPPSKWLADGDSTEPTSAKQEDSRTGAEPSGELESQSVSWLKKRFEEAARRQEAPSRGATVSQPQEGRLACQQNLKQMRSASVDETPKRLPKPCERRITGVTNSHNKVLPEQDKELLVLLQRRRFLSEGNIDSTGNTGNGAIAGRTGNTGNGAISGRTGNTGNGAISGRTGNTGNGAIAGSTGNTGNTGNTAVFGNTVPADVSSFSVEQVADHLRDLGLSAHVPAFVEGQVDGELLLSLEVTHLTRDFGLSAADATRLIHSTKPGSRSHGCTR